TAWRSPAARAPPAPGRGSATPTRPAAARPPGWSPRPTVPSWAAWTLLAEASGRTARKHEITRRRPWSPPGEPVDFVVHLVLLVLLLDRVQAGPHGGRIARGEGQLHRRVEDPFARGVFAQRCGRLAGGRS